MSAWNSVFNHPYWADAAADESETEDESDIDERAFVSRYTAKSVLGGTSHQHALPWAFDKRHRVRLYAYTYLGKKSNWVD